MRLEAGLEIVGLTLWLEEQKTLVFADLHLGYEDELHELGFLVPRFQYKEILLHLEHVLELKKPERVLINGDLKHEFGRISRQEWKEVLDFLDFLAAEGLEVILVRGNHDTILSPLAERKGLRVVDHHYFNEGRIYFTHGHILPEDEDYKASRIVVIAHDHPALGLRRGARVEKVKCFLKGGVGGKLLIQLPSLSPIAEGCDITQDQLLSPLMPSSIESFEVYCVEGFEVFYFGRLRDCLSLSLS